MTLVATIIGYFAMIVGGVALVVLLLAAAAEAAWKSVKTWLLLDQFYQWKRAKEANAALRDE